MSHISLNRQEHGDGVPKPVLRGAAILIGLSLIACAAARLTDIGTLRMPPASAVETLALRFEDRADGSIAVLDASDGRPIHTVRPGTNGFIRSTLRGLARERLRAGLDGSRPFALTRWNDGTVSLIDDATGRRVSLDAFGPDNVGAFAQFFAAERSAR